MVSGDCSDLSKQTPIALEGGVQEPVKEVQDNAPSCTKDWDELEAWIKTVRPLQPPKSLKAADITAGEAEFKKANCTQCHSGPGWTLSRRFFTPSKAKNQSLTTDAFSPPSAWPTSWNAHTFQIATQPASADPGQADAAGPTHISCVLRAINTFGVPGNQTSTDALEKRANGKRAQGAGGYNIPSLYSLAVKAPYLHHGQAKTLEDLFDKNGPFANHMQAGNPAYDPSAAERDALIAYLLSITAATPTLAIPSGFDGCPQ